MVVDITLKNVAGYIFIESVNWNLKQQSKRSFSKKYPSVRHEWKHVWTTVLSQEYGKILHKMYVFQLNWYRKSFWIEENIKINSFRKTRTKNRIEKNKLDAYQTYSKEKYAKTFSNQFSFKSSIYILQQDLYKT